MENPESGSFLIRRLLAGLLRPSRVCLVVVLVNVWTALLLITGSLQWQCSVIILNQF